MRIAVRIATWNVNSIKQRLPRLLPWLDERQPDVVCLQETKLADDKLAELLGSELEHRGYAVAAHGEAAWNGVAILSRVGLDDVVAGLPGGPGFPHQEARAVAATCAGVRVVSVYVPNGREPESDHYRYKLAWLASLRDVLAAAPEATVVCGDMNIAPTDEDVFDPDAYAGQTHVTPPERAALAALRGARVSRRRARPLAARAGVHLLGLPGRDVPPGLRDADRPRARQRTRSQTASGPPGWTARPARARGRAITRR